ncbi:MAG TPA: double-strand break repair helicase AddA, partial [Alphaproteobacteria bacterium]|nr:double-strand break repair helicase AddA [Alphaproteobacteria bacterium]
DGGIDHVLIDEAQDTNPEQWEVAAAIAEEFFAGAGAREAKRTIFAVGDTKQSIFGFQRADPQAFVDMRDHFARRAREAGMEFATVPLQLSYRSTRAVLVAVDAVFAQPVTGAGVALEGGEIRHESFRTGEAGMVELWPPIAPRASEPREAWAPALAVEPGDSPRRRLAERIAGEVARWLGEGAMLESQGRPIQPGDVMILVRRRNSLVDELVRAFKAHDIPVAGVDRMVLVHQLAIMDLVALGRFLLLPEDDLTLATVLKGPLFGFDEEALFALAQPRRGTLWAELRRRGHENPLFGAAEAELTRLAARADFAPPYELFAELLSARGGRSRIVARLGPEAEDPLDEFLAACLAFERTHTPSLEGFLHWLEAGEQEIKRDLEEGAREEVRIMTVHGAKGLQAPIVFLPDTLQTPTRTPALLWLGDVMLWSPRVDDDGSLAATARDAARAARDAEHRRLLYVAMTRARDRLYICGYLANRSAPEGCWYRLIEPALRDIAQPVAIELGEGESGLGLRLVCPQERPIKPRSEAAVAIDATALPRWAREPAPPEPSSPKPLVPSAPAEVEPAVRSPFGADDGARFKRGRLIHRLLQSLPDLAPERRARAAAAFLARKVHGLAPAEQDEIARETLAIFATPDFAALFGPASRAEAPIVGRVGDRVISGQVDRLCVLPHEVLVVDYKTNRPPPESPSRVPELYYSQMAAYRAALERIYPGREVRCALLWTVGPRLMELPQAALDRFARGG